MQYADYWHMAQAAQAARYGPREQPCRQYTVHKQGNSLAVTVPEMVNLARGTAVNIGAGRYRGHVLYLKVIPADGPYTQPESRRITTTVQGERITEEIEQNDYYKVGTGKNKTLTIPVQYTAERFERKTEPMLVTGTNNQEFTYLKLIPEGLFRKAGSIAVDDLVRAEHHNPV